MNPFAFSKPANVKTSHFEQLLTERLARTPNLRGAVMASIDGHVKACAFSDGHAQEAARIAAIASSVLALSESFSQETLGGRVQFNSVATSQGNIVTVRIPSKNGNYALCVWADKADIFAMTLRFTLDTADKLAVLVDEDR